MDEYARDAVTACMLDSHYLRMRLPSYRLGRQTFTINARGHLKHLNVSLSATTGEPVTHVPMGTEYQVELLRFGRGCAYG
mgnify:CR=1 FL=1